VGNLSFEVLEKNWSASEELLFLHGLDIFGFGNWDDISNHI